MISGEATNTNVKVFGLTRSGLEPTIYHIWGEHAYNYTTDAVVLYEHFIFSLYTSIINTIYGYSLTLPSIISYIIQPNPHQSGLNEYLSFFTTSGAEIEINHLKQNINNFLIN